MLAHAVFNVVIVAQRFQIFERQRPKRRVHVGALLAEPNRLDRAAFIGQFARQRIVGVSEIEVSGGQQALILMDVAHGPISMCCSLIFPPTDNLLCFICYIVCLSKSQT